MAAEAVHLSALHDAFHSGQLQPQCQAFLADKVHWEAARLGAVIVDFPYFQQFPIAALRHAFRIPQVESEWGNIIHQECPVALGRGFVNAAAFLKKNGDRRRARLMLAQALGYFSHLAVDTATHPFINSMARARCRNEGGDEGNHHRDIEKYQSIIFHEVRNGFDFMGHTHLRKYVEVHSAFLTHDLPLLSAWRSATKQAFRPRSIPARDFRQWATGYKQYGALIASPVGRTLAPEIEKKREWPRVFEGPDINYLELFDYAVTKAIRYMNRVWDYSQGAAFDDTAIPEGGIDDPPMPTDFHPPWRKAHI